MKPAAVVVLLACLGALGGLGPASAAGQNPPGGAALVISNDDGELARVPLDGGAFAVSYRNSIYGTPAEERYTALPGGRFLLTQIAADQLAVLEEYYAVPSPPVPSGAGDRRDWVVPPNPDRPAEFVDLSLAATDLGQRTLHVPGRPPLELWQLVDDASPFVVLNIEENS